jgi:hypothetical protein
MPTQRLEDWISDLYDDNFARRQKAIETLAALAASNARAARALRDVGVTDFRAINRAANERQQQDAQMVRRGDQRAHRVDTWLEIFRNGNEVERKEAVANLQQLGEVEVF